MTGFVRQTTRAISTRQRLDSPRRDWRRVQRQTIKLLLFACCLLPFAFAQSDYWRAAREDFRFDPARDAANHHNARIEWWNYTGHLTARDGRRFAYQLKFIRYGVEYQPSNPSRWAVRDLLITQASLTEIDGKQFHHAERVNRLGEELGLAGASAPPAPFKLWNEDWEAGGDGLRAMTDAFGLELTLEPAARTLEVGARGFVQRGLLEGNASNYVAQTRMPTRGALTINGERVEVTGTSALDHEFGSFFQEQDQRGWHWLRLHLDDGSEVILYQFKRADDAPNGLMDENSFVTLAEAKGEPVTFTAEQFTLEALSTWKSPQTGASYPTRWRLQLPARGLDLTITAALATQEVAADTTLGASYWAGAIEVTDARTGHGFAELIEAAGTALAPAGND